MMTAKQAKEAREWLAFVDRLIASTERTWAYDENEKERIIAILVAQKMAALRDLNRAGMRKVQS